nr:MULTISPECIES: hypothetical protein [unclassified Streptomyces]
MTAVGGTSLAVGQDDTYQRETGWGTAKAFLAAGGTAWETLPGAFAAGGGGGTSKTVAQPSYQGAVVPDTLALANGGATKQRVVPDISAVADPNTGFLVAVARRSPTGRCSTASAAPVEPHWPPLWSPVSKDLSSRHAAGSPWGSPTLPSTRGTVPLSFRDVTDHPLGAAVSPVSTMPTAMTGRTVW